MKATTLSQIAQWAGGYLLQGVPSDTIERISTDTRSIQKGDFFIALKGERFNAHDHLGEAIKKGAKAILVNDLPIETEGTDCGIIRVKNTLVGLQELARNYRNSLNLRVVGITGSSGKTSTKDLIGAVLRRKLAVHTTAGNFNNHIGLPLTILDMDESVEAAVLEMGMSHPGEIELLAEIAGPQVAVITNIGTAHIEFMKTREAIAQEKGMLAEAIDKDGCVVLPAADAFTESIRERCRGKVVTAGIGTGEVQARDLVATLDGTKFVLEAQGKSVPAELQIPGEHMVSNATLAAAVGLEMGLSLKQVAAGLKSVELTKGRMERKTVAGLNVLDDSYNANPESMRAALRTLAGLPVKGKRIAVLGRMAELGDAEEAEHWSLGEFVSGQGIDVMLSIGDTGEVITSGTGQETEAHVFANHAELADYLRAEAGPDDLVLLKGSRAAQMEQVLTHLTTTA